MSSITVRPLGYALGATVTGINLARPLGDALIAEIRKAWLDHIVLCFPGQKLEAEAFMDFCRQFGPLSGSRNSPAKHPQFPDIMLLTNAPVVVNGQAIDKFYAASQWHSDRQITDHPATATFLLAQQLPDVGGNTMWANMYLAYETLSSLMRNIAEQLSAVHDITMSVEYPHLSPEEQVKKRRDNPSIVHPLVRVHPETGRKALFIGRRIRKFVGMTEEETRPLLDFLNQHAVRYEFVYRHAWTVNDVMMWDNRCALHHAVEDYDGRQLRRMIRCSTLPAQSGYVYTEEPPS